MKEKYISNKKNRQKIFLRKIEVWIEKKWEKKIEVYMNWEKLRVELRYGNRPKKTYRQKNNLYMYISKLTSFFFPNLPEKT